MRERDGAFPESIHPFGAVESRLALTKDQIRPSCADEIIWRHADGEGSETLILPGVAFGEAGGPIPAAEWTPVLSGLSHLQT